MTNWRLGALLQVCVAVAPCVAGCATVLSIDEATPRPGSCEGSMCTGAGDGGTSGSGDGNCEEEGELGCDVYQPRVCRSGKWELSVEQRECKVYCKDGECVAPPSCEDTAPCANGVSCCETIWVPEGSFDAEFDGHEFPIRHPRSISGFYLDRFEVTVGRFYRFLESYPTVLPQAGEGAHPRIHGSGWRDEWLDFEDVDGNPAVPRDVEGLQDMVECEGTTADGPESTLPTNCINWYVAFAFCSWDGGRLPTDAEWNYAASHGDEHRVYPWSTGPGDEAIDENFAWYLANATEPQVVGGKPKGRSGFFRREEARGHDDLAGNVMEWVLDGDGTSSLEPRVDYMIPWTTEARSLRGGYFGSVSSELKNGLRSVENSQSVNRAFGFRCARDERTK